ncbi:MAG: DsrE family protein [Gammaproteobacteria bacterium]|nr:DsrE family protein [Gammaproteobacteria bacterium]
MFVSLAMLSVNNVFAADGYGKQKVVYHINYDNPKAQAGALRNIGNHIRAVGAENLDAKVVLHGKGLSLLLDPAAKSKLPKGNGTDQMNAKVSTLKDLGVAFAVCANTLKGKKISYENDLFDVQKADIVKSGVAELSALQMQGYTYIKP